MEEISLADVNRENWMQCIALSVNEDQNEFIAPNYESILLAKFEDNGFPMCIFACERFVQTGEVMREEDVYCVSL